MVNLLLQNKSPLNATDISGLTALHHGMLSLPGVLKVDIEGGKVFNKDSKLIFDSNLRRSR